MSQLVTRVEDELLAEVDRLIEEGAVISRSDAVRKGLYVLVDQHRRKRIGEAIVQGYTTMPQTESETSWNEAAAIAMINEEPW
ncbi:MAG: ribbon-helix-helix domain-containing protein [Acidimicrobiia bacterium]